MKKSVEELLVELHELGIKARKLQRDAEGYLLLDPDNPDDREWYENDDAYKISNLFQV